VGIFFVVESPIGSGATKKAVGMKTNLVLARTEITPPQVPRSDQVRKIVSFLSIFAT